MNLRQARKIEKRLRHRATSGELRPYRPTPRWWMIYPLTTLKRAEAAMRRSWRAHRTTRVDEDGKRWLGVTQDWFRANRLRSCAIRQPLIKAMRREAVSRG